MPPATRSGKKTTPTASEPASKTKFTTNGGTKRSAPSTSKDDDAHRSEDKAHDGVNVSEDSSRPAESNKSGEKERDTAEEGPPAKKQKTLEQVGVVVEPADNSDRRVQSEKDAKNEDKSGEMDVVVVTEEDAAKSSPNSKEEGADAVNEQDDEKIDFGSKPDPAHDQDCAKVGEIAAQTADTDAKQSTTEKESGEANAKEPKSSTTSSVPEEQKEAEGRIVGHEDVKEYGQIHFAFRPRVATPHPKSIDDVQRLHIILQPHAKNDPSGKPVLSRLIQIAKKVLPGKGSPTGGTGGRGETFWGYVSEVSENVEDLHGRMQETSQETQTMGTRVTPADRIIATGPYALISQSSTKDPSNPRRSTHLIYTLTAPMEMGEVQKAFNLSKEGSFGISVKNPKKGSAPGTGLSTPAEFSDELQGKMSTLRWHAVDPPQYLDYVNAEFIFTAHNPHSITETLQKSTEDHADETEHEGQDIADELRQIAEAEADGHHVNEEGKKGAGQGVVEWVVGMLKAKGTVEGGAESLIKGHWE